MTHSAAYIVPAGFMRDVTMLDGPFAQAWQANGIPADPTLELVVVHWENLNAEAEFEARPEVLALGAPWEPLPADVAPLLASLEDPSLVPNAVIASTTSVASPDTATTTQPETVYSALRKTWIGRSVR